MSSTADHFREGAPDFYPTPLWCVDRLFDAFEPPEGKWLEPGAGNGQIIRAASHHGFFPDWTAIELQPELETNLLQVLPPESVLCPQDFFEINPLGRFDLAIGNPPFNLAMQFIEKCLDVAYTTAFLLRLNFLGTAKRAPFFHDRMPDVYILPDRPSFKGGRRDSIEYAWFVWRSGVYRTWGRTVVLPTTPLKVRKERNHV